MLRIIKLYEYFIENRFNFALNELKKLFSAEFYLNLIYFYDKINTKNIPI